MCRTVLENSTALNKSLHYGMSANVITFKVKIGWSPQLEVVFETLQVCGTSKVTEAACLVFFSFKFRFSNITCNKKIQSSRNFSEGLFAVGH